MIRLTIDGHEISVPPGTLIADAAKQLDRNIPVYCYHEALGSLGACRMCLVAVEKMPKLVTACTMPVAEGMVVHTTGPSVEKGQKGVLEFLLINHPLDCPVCDKGGECFLQDYTFEYGPPQGRFSEPKIQKVKDGPISEFVLIDQERCVLCQRCVRFMDDYVGENELLLQGRGVETVVTIPEGQPMVSQFGGNIIDLCPVGALLSRPYRYKGRPWNIKKKESVCPHCPVGCPTVVTERDGQVLRVEGRPIPGREWGWLCDRGRFGYDFATGSDRLTMSSINGKETSSAQAMRDVGSWLKQTKAAGENIAFVVGGTHTIEDAHSIKMFAETVVQTTQIAMGNAVLGYLPRALNGTYADLSMADTVVYLGQDPYNAAPVVHLKLRDRLRHFPKLKVIGLGAFTLTRNTMPGQNFTVPFGYDAVALGLAIQRAWPESASVQTLTSHVGTAEIGLTEEQLLELGRTLQNSEKLTLLWDGQNSEMETVLSVLAEVRAGDTRVLPMYAPANWRGFEAAGIPVEMGDLVEILERAASGAIKMLFLWGDEVLDHVPDQALVKKALAMVDYVIYEGITRPQAPERYQAILPGAAWGEVAGHYANMEGRAQWAEMAAVPPGQSRPVKSYLTAWARALRHSFTVDENWKPAMNDEGLLILPAEETATVPPLSDPGNEISGYNLVYEFNIWGTGLPSANLSNRRHAVTGRINPDDAQQWGIPLEGGRISIVQDDLSQEMSVMADAQIPRNTVVVPYSSVASLTVGPCDIRVMGEVKSR